MAVAIRLSRGGNKKRPYYRIVVSDTRSPRDGKYLEQIGTYNPLLAKDDENRVKLNEDRARYWLGVGAQATDRVARFLDAAGIKERAEERAAKQAEAEEAAKAAEEEVKAPAAEETAQSTDEPAEGSENPATGEDASVGASTDEPAEGSEEAAQG